MIERWKIHSRDEWLALRSQDLTASDVGAWAGVDPWKSPLTLYAEKTGMLMPQADNPSMRRGRWLEAAVLSAIREEHPDWEVRPANIYLRDPELRLGATPDAIAETDVPGLTNIQCKVVSRPVYERDWTDGPPLGYQLQTLTEGMLLEASTSYVAALVIDTYSADLFLHPVSRHEAAEARVMALASSFWSRVAAGNPPPADYSRDEETIDAMFPQSVKEPVLDLSGDNALGILLPRRAVLKEQMALDQKALAEIDTEIKAKVGAAEKATLPGWKISWKSVHRNESVTKAYDYRPLVITEIEEKTA